MAENSFKIQPFVADSSVLLRAGADYVSFKIPSTDIGGGTFTVTEYLGDGQPTPAIPATDVLVVGTLAAGESFKYEFGSRAWFWLTLSGSTAPDINPTVRNSGNE
jgi:hypothetical protein